MEQGVDYVHGPAIADLKKAGITFVCRYLSFINGVTLDKVLKPLEAMELGQAGMPIVSNYEWYANRPLEGVTAGKQDAQIAAAQHAACGGPSDRPIYFSVDLDTTGVAVIPYFHGVSETIGLKRTGAYGSIKVLRELFDAGAISWGWQTYAWSNGVWDTRAVIHQYQNDQIIGLAHVDLNRALVPDFGQWIAKKENLMPTAQEKQAIATWKSTTCGMIAKGGLVQASVGLFPAGGTPDFTTGIAKSWLNDEYANGRNWGPPISYEYDSVDGVPLTDWNGNPISQQNFLGGRCEWSKQTHTASWYGWK